MSKKALVPLGLIAAAGVMGSLANGQGNKRGRRVSRKTGLRAPSNALVEKPFSYGSTSEREVLEALHLQALETCDQTYADYAPPEVLRGLERKGYITQNRGTPSNWTLTSKGLKWADKKRGLDGKRGRRAKHSGDAPYPPVSEVLGEAYTEIKPGTYVLEAPWGKFMVRAVVKKFGVLGWSWAVLLHGRRIGYGVSPTQRVAFARVEDVLRYDTHGRTARRAKHSKRDFVRQVWERQAPTMAGGPLPPPIPGMEGPFRYRSGRVLYWDPKEGAYYDRGRDMYVEVEDVESAMSGRR